ncbi:hypothetical protein CYMTET_46052 [Cymbomonas tetramitiformis]|uniref:Uncharacterized protein n=1 Tax=Cymbomonas tetramitiformis TaxID=36881 RepID=A0AAE0BY47_9CHLO|nr:hypothetical protein CYMTET_46052 [Cymbomonas tetramitiformis]
MNNAVKSAKLSVEARHDMPRPFERELAHPPTQAPTKLMIDGCRRFDVVDLIKDAARPLMFLNARHRRNAQVLHLEEVVKQACKDYFGLHLDDATPATLHDLFAVRLPMVETREYVCLNRKPGMHGVSLVAGNLRPLKFVEGATGMLLDDDLLIRECDATRPAFCVHQFTECGVRVRHSGDAHVGGQLRYGRNSVVTIETGAGIYDLWLLQQGGVMRHRRPRGLVEP